MTAVRRKAIDAVASDPGTGSLIFSYIVGTTEHTPDLRIAAVHLNGASVRDAGGAGADFSAALDVPTGLPIDPAVVTSVQSLETEVDTGGIAHVALYLSQGIMLVTGTPLLMLNDGATASYDAGASAPDARAAVVRLSSDSPETLTPGPHHHRPPVSWACHGPGRQRCQRRSVRRDRSGHRAWGQPGRLLRGAEPGSPLAWRGSRSKHWQSAIWCELNDGRWE